jgi:hypothetical protein
MKRDGDRPGVDARLAPAAPRPATPIPARDVPSPLEAGALRADRRAIGAVGVLAMQRSVGNQAVGELLAGRGARRGLQVQRHEGPSMPGDIQPGTGTGSGGAGGGLDYAGIARRLRDAMEGLGTDEDAIYAALGELGQDQTKITALQTAYRALTGNSLDADLEDDLSGAELARAQRLLRPPDRRQQIETLLGTTDTGRWVLGILSRWSIPVDYEYAGMGSFHQAGRIFVNRTLSVDAAVLVMMHEAQHANTFKSGQGADVDSLARDEYIRRMIADEAEAVVRQIEGSVPMQAAGHSLVGSGINQGLIDRYRTAFYAYRDLLEANNPTMSRAEINNRCRTRTRDVDVTSWFHDGTFVTSTGNITYSQHYGNAWDAAHNPPSPAPQVPEEVGA